ncbi:MAG TPA: peptidylprolyl isomerase [Bryobacteraceae bacterium]|jgi:parvulin-like peptidyl-prolyl isomerase|nr:peptidylprolyl isomerase [Bryobacteraceae bacterium]
MKAAFLVGLAFASVCFAAADNPKETPKIVDQIVAKVNGDIVSQDEIERYTKELPAQLKAQGVTGSQFNQELAHQEKDVLRGRIDELLLVQKGKELNINVDSELSKYVANLQRQSGIVDTDKFHEYVRQGSGMSYEDFISETKNQILTREVVGQEVGRKINITDQEIQAYYDAHKSEFVREEKVYLSEILISIEGKDAAGIAAAEKKAKQISSDASRGERFSDLARDNSDAATAKDGGVLAGYKKDEMSPEIAAAVWTKPKGYVTPPIKLATGYDIFRVDDHTKAGLAPLADVKQDIENQLYGPKMQPKVREYLTDLRKQAFLQIKPGFVDTGAAPGKDTKWQEVAQLKPETVTKAEVEQKTRHKRLLGLIPIPGTETTVTGKSSSR